MSADVVRVLSADGVPVRDLPARSGVSKEAITAAVGFLQRNGCAAVEPDPASRSKLVRLTEQGLAAQAQHVRLARAVELRWRKRLDGDLDRLAKALITGRQLALGLQPYPDGWRAARNRYRARTQAVLADRHRRCRGTRWSCTGAGTPTEARSAIRYTPQTRNGPRPSSGRTAGTSC
jgi:DNA-binding MarR family transcriptional regulator